MDDTVLIAVSGVITWPRLMIICDVPRYIGQRLGSFLMGNRSRGSLVRVVVEVVGVVEGSGIDVDVVVVVVGGSIVVVVVVGN